MIRHIIKAKIVGENRKRNLIRETMDDGTFVFRKYKRKIHKWGDKYGPYNTLKQKAGECVSWNISANQVSVDLKTVEVILDITGAKRIAIGYNY